MKSAVFSDFRNRARDAEERTASGRLFHTEVAAAEKALSPMVARTVREMTSVVDDEERSRRRVQTSETRCSCLDR